MTRFVILCAACLLASVAQAVEDFDVTGSSFLGEESCAAGLKTPGCILSFQLEGKAAEQLYKGMRVKSKKDECTESDVKDDGNGLRCTDEGEGKFACDFGYSFKDKKFGSSEVTC